mmetsp:Transcript_2942/g.3359  ORF Transcript_2942/g.3359 Transcript_2942/m.3359 type:complete len:285 (+) Transcript_2942:162-1016(+)
MPICEPLQQVRIGKMEQKTQSGYKRQGFSPILTTATFSGGTGSHRSQDSNSVAKDFSVDAQVHVVKPDSGGSEYGRQSSNRTDTTSLYSSVQREISSKSKASEEGKGERIHTDEDFEVGSISSRSKYVKSEYNYETLWSETASTSKSVMDTSNRRRRGGRRRVREGNYVEMNQQAKETSKLLQDLHHSQDLYDDELEIIEQEMNILEESVHRALEVLSDQIKIALKAKQERCEQTCERIKQKYEKVSAIRAKTGEHIPKMIENQTEVVMKRVLESLQNRRNESL